MSVKLYMHNESGEVVAAVITPKSYKLFDSTGGSFFECKDYFEQTYTPLPEAPEVYYKGLWAWMMMLGGNKVQKKNSSEKRPFWINTKDGVFDLMVGDDIAADFSLFHFMNSEWVLYAGNKPIVECLPHDFVEGQACLARLLTCDKWEKIIFGGKVTYDKCRRYGEKDKRQGRDIIEDLGNPPNYYTYCIPYYENAHLEGQVTDGEHGAVPKGYVPPHVPKLGDETYWMVGDKVVDLAEFYSTRIITHVFENHIVTKHSEDSSLITYYTKNGCFIDASNMRDCGTLRVLYHDTSYVRDDGTVHEYIPTRPHKKIDTDTTGA